MRFEIWLTVSFICYVAMLIGTFVISRLPYRKARLITPNRVLVAGTFISAVILLLPFYLEKLFEDKGLLEYVKAIIISAIHSMKLFAFEPGYANCFESEIIRGLEPTLRTLYSGFGALLYVWAPIMTMKIVISFFRDASAYLKYVFSFRKHTHVFSALNEKSFALAKSIDKKYNMSERNPNKYKLLRKEFFVFCGVPAQDGKSELVERARELGAVCFAKDLNAINFLKTKRSKRELSFYLISEDEKDNVRHAESTMRSYDLPKVDLRVFSSDVRAELLLAVKDVKDIRVVRVNEARSLIYHHLDVHGHRLFEKARLGENGEKISKEDREQYLNDNYVAFGQLLVAGYYYMIDTDDFGDNVYYTDDKHTAIAYDKVNGHTRKDEFGFEEKDILGNPAYYNDDGRIAYDKKNGVLGYVYDKNGEKVVSFYDDEKLGELYLKAEQFAYDADGDIDKFKELADIYDEGDTDGKMMYLFSNVGYYAAQNDAYAYLDDITKELAKMDVGECRVVESDYGYHVICKYEVEEGVYDSEEQKDVFSDFYDGLVAYMFDEECKKYESLVKIDSAVMAEAPDMVSVGSNTLY